MDWKDEANAAAAAAGFDQAICIDWDWAAADANRNVDTIDDRETELGANGVLVVRFTPTPPADDKRAQISVTNYPGDQPKVTNVAAISTKPCDMNPTEPKTVSRGQTPKLWFVVGTSPVVLGTPTSASLTPGVTYYLNVTGGGSEIRVQLQKPRGH